MRNDDLADIAALQARNASSSGGGHGLYIVALLDNCLVRRAVNTELTLPLGLLTLSQMPMTIDQPNPHVYFDGMASIKREGARTTSARQLARSSSTGSMLGVLFTRHSTLANISAELPIDHQSHRPAKVISFLTVLHKCTSPLVPLLEFERSSNEAHHQYPIPGLFGKLQ